MPGNDLSLYCAVFTVDGVAHVMSGHTANKETMQKAVKNIIDSRNANVPSEKAEVSEENMFFGVSEAQIKELAERVKAANPDNSDATELAPLAPNLILHKSVKDLRADGGAREVENAVGDLK